MKPSQGIHAGLGYAGDVIMGYDEDLRDWGTALALPGLLMEEKG
jgi:hypothetical protein